MSLPENLLDPALYVDVRRPLLQARTLPPWCYSSPEFYRAELKHIFATGWTERWDSATPEDNAIAGRQQRGQEVAARVAGRFSASEFAVHGFDNWVLERVLGDRAGA